MFFLETSNQWVMAEVMPAACLVQDFINDLEEVTECLLNFAKSKGAVDIYESRTAIQRDLDRLEECTKRKLLKFSKCTFKVCTATVQAGN